MLPSLFSILHPLAAPLIILFWIENPLIVSLSYRLLKNHEGSLLLAPRLIIAGVFAMGGLLWMVRFQYAHFIYWPVFFSCVYLLMLRDGRYGRADAFVLSCLSMLSINSLWESPFNLINWTQSVSELEIGLTAGALEMMAIPLFFFFFLRVNHGWKASSETRLLLLLNGLLVVPMLYWVVNFEYMTRPALFGVFLYDLPEASLLIWFLFFVSLFWGHARRE